MSFCQYKKLKREISPDNGITWYAPNNPTYRKGSLIMCGLEDCIEYDPNKPLVYQWVVVEGEYFCDNFNKFYKLKKQQSWNDGETWVDVNPPEYLQGDLMEENSSDCDYGYNWHHTDMAFCELSDTGNLYYLPSRSGKGPNYWIDYSGNHNICNVHLRSVFLSEDGTTPLLMPTEFDILDINRDYYTMPSPIEMFYNPYLMTGNIPLGLEYNQPIRQVYELNFNNVSRNYLFGLNLYCVPEYYPQYVTQINGKQTAVADCFFNENLKTVKMSGTFPNLNYVFWNNDLCGIGNIDAPRLQHAYIWTTKGLSDKDLAMLANNVRSFSILGSGANVNVNFDETLFRCDLSPSYNTPPIKFNQNWSKKTIDISNCVGLMVCTDPQYMFDNCPVEEINFGGLYFLKVDLVKACNAGFIGTSTTTPNLKKVTCCEKMKEWLTKTYENYYYYVHGRHTVFYYNDGRIEWNIVDALVPPNDNYGFQKLGRYTYEYDNKLYQKEYGSGYNFECDNDNPKSFKLGEEFSYLCNDEYHVRDARIGIGEYKNSLEEIDLSNLYFNSSSKGMTLGHGFPTDYKFPFNFSGFTKLKRLDISNFRMACFLSHTYGGDTYSSEDNIVESTKYNNQNCDILKIKVLGDKQYYDLFESCDNLEYIKCDKTFRSWLWSDEERINQLPDALKPNGSCVWELV